MNPVPGLERCFAYAIALESERVMREFAQGSTEECTPPRIEFHAAADLAIELSIVIPAWNPKPEHFKRCLTSLARANLAELPHEIIVSDDASPADTVRRLCDEARLPGLRYVRQEKNHGGFGNFNWCLSAARGTWIHMLHQDDWIEPDFYGELLRGPGAASGAPLRFCRTQLFYEGAGQTRLMFDESPMPGILPNFIRRQCVSQRLQISGTMLRRAELAEMGGYDARLGTGADWEYWARWVARYPVFYSPRVLATYSLHAGSWSTRETAGDQKAESLALHRLVLRRILCHLPQALHQFAASGFYRNMMGRLVEYALQNNRASRVAENRRLLAALLPGCTEHGLCGDIERLLSTLR